MVSSLRRRRPNSASSVKSDAPDAVREKNFEQSLCPVETLSACQQNSNTTTMKQSKNVLPSLTYFGAKWMILRCMGIIYFFAFWVAHDQNPGLMGKHGLVPAEKTWSKVIVPQFPDPWQGFLHHPSIFWFIPLNDDTISWVNWIGLVVSGMIVILSINSWILQFVLWALYFSVVTTATNNSFYQYGWESQILETGFLCIFLCSLPYVDRSRRSFSPSLWESWNPTTNVAKREQAPSYIILWLFRYLCFRISVGAGLIKVRGDSCWTDKTCLHYHFETQPIPSPFSFVYHFVPKSFQSRMVDVDLWVQLYTSFLVVLPTETFYPPLTALCRFIVRLGGLVQALFMMAIALSGNFSFLNHLTIIPAIACLDDFCWPHFLHRFWMSGASVPSTKGRFLPRNFLDAILLMYIGYLSSPVISNLLQLDGQRQAMNASYDPFRLVNTYGAFGSVGEKRFEPIVMISDDGHDWTELEFPCKPGRVTRQPCFIAPYHRRVDWNIWFIGFKPHQMYLQRRETWLYRLLEKILEKDFGTPKPWLDLLDTSTSSFLQSTYYDHAKAPRYAKVDMYHYRMAAPLHDILYERWSTGKEVLWWERAFEESLVPTLEVSSNGMLQAVRQV